MFHNGSMKNNWNFKNICRLKQKMQTMKISLPNSQMASQGLVLSRNPFVPSNSMEMEEHWQYSLRWALEKRVGRESMICHQWEIFKLLFILHNVKPLWIKFNKFSSLSDLYKVYFRIIKTYKRAGI